jgi:hypothetical protein
VRSVVARDRSLSDVSGSIGGVEAGDEEVELDREEEGLTFECCSVAKRGREILGPAQSTVRAVDVHFVVGGLRSN